MGRNSVRTAVSSVPPLAGSQTLLAGWPSDPSGWPPDPFSWLLHTGKVWQRLWGQIEIRWLGSLHFCMNWEIEQFCRLLASFQLVSKWRCTRLMRVKSMLLVICEVHHDNPYNLYFISCPVCQYAVIIICFVYYLECPLILPFFLCTWGKFHRPYLESNKDPVRSTIRYKIHISYSIVLYLRYVNKYTSPPIVCGCEAEVPYRRQNQCSGELSIAFRSRIVGLWKHPCPPISQILAERGAIFHLRHRCQSHCINKWKSNVTEK